MRRKFAAVLILLIALVLLRVTIDTSTAVHQASLLLNNTGSAQSNVVGPFRISGQALSDGTFMATDTLNGVITEGTELVASQPPSLLQSMEFAKQDDGGVFTTYTTEANNSTINDFNLLPAVPVTNDAFYFGGNHRFRILTLNIGTAGSGTWDITWEYETASGWVAVPNVDDRTNGFTESGTHTISFDLPDDWIESTVDGGVSYWVRARVSAFTSLTVQPLGTQAWWETGVWWTFTETLGDSAQKTYTLSTGGATDFVANHQFFPGDSGYITTDSASIELGQNYRINLTAYVNTDGTNTTGSVFNKDSAIRLYNPMDGVLALVVSGTTVTQVTSVPTGEYTIEILDDSDSVSLSVSGIGSDSAASIAVPDNSNNWEWGTNGVVPYFDQVEISFPLAEIQSWNDDMEAGTRTTIDVITNPNALTTDISFTALAQAGDTAFDGTSLWAIDSDDTFESYNVSTGASNGSCSLTAVAAGVWTSVAFDGTNFWVGNATDDNFYHVNSSCVSVGGTFASPVNMSTNARITFDGTDIWLLDNTTTVYQIDTTGVQLSTFTPSVSLPNRDGTDDSSPTYTGIEWDTNRGYLWLVFRTDVPVSTWTSAYQRAGIIAFETNGTVHHWWTASPNWPHGHSETETIIATHLAYDPTNDIFWVTPSAAPLRLTGWDGSLISSGQYVIHNRGFLLRVSSGCIDSLENLNNGVIGWTISTGQVSIGNCTVTPEYATDGTYSHSVRGPNTGTAFGLLTQQLTASAGQTWSFGMDLRPSVCSSLSKLEILFRQSTSTLATHTATTPCTIGAFSRLQVENVTAPATTDNVLITWGVRNNGQVAYGDGLYAGQTVTDEGISSSNNLLTNPSFEQIYHDEGIRVSENINIGSITNVLRSSINWTETTPTNTTVLVETTIDGGSNWSPATSGESVPDIDPLDDLTGLFLAVRVTLSTTDNLNTPTFSNLSITILDDSGQVMQYAPQELIGLTLTDLTGNGNNATASYPNPSQANLTFTTGSLIPTGVASVKDPQDDIPGNVSENEPPDNLISLTTNFDLLPGASIANFIADHSDFPAEGVWAFGAFILTLLVIAGTLWLTKGSLTAAGGTGTFTVLLVTNIGAGGIVPLFVFGLIAVGVIGLLVWNHRGKS